MRASCVCYGKGRGWLHAAHRERDFVPELDAALRILDESLEVLVTAAAGRTLSRVELRSLFALCDFPFWWALTAGGLTDREAEEAFYLLAGSVELYVDDQVHQVEAGAFCLVPPGTPHSFTSTSAEPARMLLVVSPSGFERFFAEVEQQFPEADGMPTPEQVGPALDQLASKYGLRIVGPPPQ